MGQGRNWMVLPFIFTIAHADLRIWDGVEEVRVDLVAMKVEGLLLVMPGFPGLG